MADRKRKQFHRCSCRECKSRRHPEVAEYHRSINRVMGQLDERSRRLFAGLLARQFGRGGRQRVLDIAGLSRMTISRGPRECDKSRPAELDRVRRAGGGRKLIKKKSPHVKDLLKELLKDSTAGDPMGGLRWTHKTTRNLAAALNRRGVAISHATVGRLLHEMKYSLRTNCKRLAKLTMTFPVVRTDEQFHLRISLEVHSHNALDDRVSLPCYTRQKLLP